MPEPRTFQKQKVRDGTTTTPSPSYFHSLFFHPLRIIRREIILSLIQNCIKMSMIPSFFDRRSNSVFDPFSLEVWDPFEGWPFNSNFRQLSANFPSSSEAASFARAMVDWKETPNAHVFKADVPGLRKEEVKVELEDDRILQISGERKREMEDKGDTWHRSERSSGRFLRRFRLPEDAKVEGVKASMEDGVLTVTVRKVDAKKPDIKSIQISG